MSAAFDLRSAAEGSPGDGNRWLTYAYAGGVGDEACHWTVRSRWSGGVTDSNPAATASDSGVTITSRGDEFHGTSMEPALPHPALVLPMTGGKVFDLSDRPDNKVTVLFLGYTHCPDVCPTTMADLALARDLLAPDVRNRVQVLFVTEDPTRDTAVVPPRVARPLRHGLHRADRWHQGDCHSTDGTPPTRVHPGRRLGWICSSCPRRW